MVNDYANLFSEIQVNELEQRLEAFSDSTSNQICVVTISDLEGYEAADYAQRLGDAWGVGSKKNNGVIILLKPRNEFGGGDFFIATGYGVEGVLTDATCKNIFQNNVLPILKEENCDYYQAIVAAVNRIVPLLNEEYHEEYNAKKENKQPQETPPLLIIIVAGIVGFVLYSIFPSKKKRACSAISNANTLAELNTAIEKAKELQVKESKIEKARSKIPNRMFSLLRNARNPEHFSNIAANATAMGISAASIMALEFQMKDNTLQELQDCRSRYDLYSKQTRARAFGNSEEDIRKATAIALAAIAAMALAARRSSSHHGSGFGGNSGGGFGGFGGGRFGGGGAGGKF
ncbi:MAG: TPM domain-containing protein [Bacteroidales bacterium]|nr:TPM domain-containing protein [Bacteroidales bacterium]